MELQIAYPSQLLIYLLQRTILITGVVTRVSSQNGMVSIPLEAPLIIYVHTFLRLLLSVGVLE